MAPESNPSSARPTPRSTEMKGVESNGFGGPLEQKCHGSLSLVFAAPKRHVSFEKSKDQKKADVKKRQEFGFVFADLNVNSSKYKSCCLHGEMM